MYIYIFCVAFVDNSFSLPRVPVATESRPGGNELGDMRTHHEYPTANIMESLTHKHVSEEKEREREKKKKKKGIE